MWKALISSFGILTIIANANKKHKKTDLTSDIDLSSILHTEFTCCHDKNDEGTCLNEGAYSCIWVDDTSGQFAQDLAAQDGHSCFGEEYVRCKETANDLGACCSPGCVGPPPATPPVVGPPAPGTTGTDICFQKLPTEQPTPEPTEPACELGTDYSFEGVACQISGDPHTKMVNGNKHDFQGQPLYEDDDGNVLSQYYYITTCDGSDTDDMPFRISATHYNWGDRDVSGVDYITIELYDDNGNVYYIYLNHAIHSYALAGNAQVSTNYDDTPGGFLNAFQQNVPIILGTMFTLTYTQTDSNRVSLKIEIETIHGAAEVFIYMAGQMDIVGRSKRMHYVYLKQDSLFKCHACGLCGNYKDASTGQSVMNLEACDGSYVQFRAGWNADNTPEAYDVWGWTYEMNFYNNECGTAYDITDNTRGLNYVDPCDPNIAQDVIDKCAAEVAANSDCCDITIGGTTCADLQEDCEFDACVIATDNGGDEAAMDNAVEQVLGTAIEELCGIPDVGNELNVGNLDNYHYIGCYQDDKTTRALEHTASMNIADYNTAQCVSLCLAWKEAQNDSDSRLFMGLEYGQECFCSLSFDYATRFGLQTADKKYRCGEGQDVALYQDKSGCWGGRWTICLYEITQENGAAITKFMNHIYNDNINLNVEGVHNYINYNKPGFENQYIQMAIIGAVIILIGGVWYFKRNNKDDKYISIDDHSSNNNV